MTFVEIVLSLQREKGARDLVTFGHFGYNSVAFGHLFR